jgi:hypothetical protein
LLLARVHESDEPILIVGTQIAALIDTAVALHAK